MTSVKLLTRLPLEVDDEVVDVVVFERSIIAITKFGHIFQVELY
jgi:hypothetical protein